MTLLPADGHRRYRWRNGRGTAAEIAAESTASPDSAPGWTISIATVEADVDFSVFPGVDRWLMALSEDGLGLRIDGEHRRLERWQVARFAGESAVASIGVERSTIDLNLMVPRERFAGALRAVVVDGALTVDAPDDSIVFLVVVDGDATLGAPVPGAGAGAGAGAGVAGAGADAAGSGAGAAVTGAGASAAVALRPSDAVRLAPGDTCTLKGSATIALATITRRPPDPIP